MREKDDDPAAHLEDDGRRALARAGVRIGVSCAYLPMLLKGRVMALKALLYRLGGRPYGVLPDGGATAVPRVEEVEDGWYLALGFRPSGPVAVRADALERLLAEALRKEKEGPFLLAPEMLSPIDAPMETFVRLLR